MKPRISTNGDKSELTEKDVLMADVVCYSLLRLYLNVAYSVRYVPAKARGEQILKCLKVYLNKSRYKPIRADIRRLIHNGRSNLQGFEQKMLEIQALATPMHAQSDMQHFHACLTTLDELCPVDELACSDVARLSPDKLFLDQNKTLQAFGGQGELLVPIVIYVPNAIWDRAAVLCQSMGWRLTRQYSKQSTHVCGQLCLLG